MPKGAYMKNPHDELYAKLIHHYNDGDCSRDALFKDSSQALKHLKKDLAHNKIPQEKRDDVARAKAVLDAYVNGSGSGQENLESAFTTLASLSSIQGQSASSFTCSKPANQVVKR